MGIFIPKPLTISVEDVDKFIPKSRTIPEPILKFKAESKSTNESNELTKKVLELLSTLGSAGNLLPGTGMPVKAGIMIYKEGLKWIYIFLRESNITDAKIERALTMYTVSLINAELVAIENRITRMGQTDIPNNHRSAAVEPALHSCEKILELFQNEDSCLWKSVIPSSQSLTAFVPIYADVIKKASELMPSYKTQLKENLTQIKGTLEKYKEACVKNRLAKVEMDGKRWEFYRGNMVYKDQMDKISVNINNNKIDLDIFHSPNPWGNPCFGPSLFELTRSYKIVDQWDSWEVKDNSHHGYINYSVKLRILYENHFNEVIKKLEKITL